MLYKLIGSLFILSSILVIFIKALKPLFPQLGWLCGNFKDYMSKKFFKTLANYGSKLPPECYVITESPSSLSLNILGFSLCVCVCLCVRKFLTCIIIPSVSTTYLHQQWRKITFEGLHNVTNVIVKYEQWRKLRAAGTGLQPWHWSWLFCSSCPLVVSITFWIRRSTLPSLCLSFSFLSSLT